MLDEKEAQAWWGRIKCLKAVWAFLVMCMFAAFSFHHLKNPQTM